MTKSCAIITGASSGIGKALAQRLVSKGFLVVLADVSNKGQELEVELNKNGKKAKFCMCDVCDETQFKNLFKVARDEFGGANILVNNAGIAKVELIEQNADYIDSIVAVNLISVLKGTSFGIQDFKAQKKTNTDASRDYSIINIGSILGLEPEHRAPIYSATKKAVIYFSQTLGYLKHQGIRVNCIAPGYINTPLLGFTSQDNIKALAKPHGGFVEMVKVIDAICHLIDNKDMAGDIYKIDTKTDAVLPKDF